MDSSKWQSRAVSSECRKKEGNEIKKEEEAILFNTKKKRDSGPYIAQRSKALLEIVNQENKGQMLLNCTHLSLSGVVLFIKDFGYNNKFQGDLTTISRPSLNQTNLGFT